MKYRYFKRPQDMYIWRWNNKNGWTLSANKPDDWSAAVMQPNSPEQNPDLWYPHEMSIGLTKLKFPLATIV
jgi:hypothetical protein